MGRPPPGMYSVELYVLHNGKLEAQGSVQEFLVKPIPALEGRNFEETFAFHKELNDLSREMNSAGRSLGEASNRLRHILSYCFFSLFWLREQNLLSHQQYKNQFRFIKL